MQNNKLTFVYCDKYSLGREWEKRGTKGKHARQGLISHVRYVKLHHVKASAE